MSNDPVDEAGRDLKFLDNGDNLLFGTKTILEIIFPHGAPIVEVANQLLGGVIGKRREGIAISILKELQSRIDQFDPKTLMDNEQFKTVLLQVISVAIRSHEQEKLDALRNAAVNTALGINIDEDKQLMFINSADAMTKSHFRILRFLNDPTNYLRETKRLPTEQINFPDLTNFANYIIPEADKEFVHIIVTDLISRGFLRNTKSIYSIRPDSNPETRPLIMEADKPTTSIGKEFVNYITLRAS